MEASRQAGVVPQHVERGRSCKRQRGTSPLTAACRKKWPFMVGENDLPVLAL